MLVYLYLPIQFHMPRVTAESNNFPKKIQDLLINELNLFLKDCYSIRKFALHISDLIPNQVLCIRKTLLVGTFPKC